MVGDRQEERIRSVREEGLEEVQRFPQFCEKEVDPKVLCRFREFGEMGEVQKVEHSQNSAAS
jgi:hypothetical protein